MSFFLEQKCMLQIFFWKIFGEGVGVLEGWCVLEVKTQCKSRDEQCE